MEPTTATDLALLVIRAVVGLTLAALMIWRPQGLLGKKEESMLDAA